ncbi:MAG: protein kinase domain-containing protein [Nannocystaceae bacterium]|nr:protein kinase [bacterium]
MSEPRGRFTAALRGADFSERAGPDAPTLPPGHGRTRQFRLGATFVPDPEPQVPEGALLGARERFRVVRLLGQGGMGRVYEARRERDGRPAALKVLRTDRVAGNLEELVARFRQEASAASRVGHRGIVEVLGFEKTPDGRVLLAMELLRGQTLEDWMSAEGTLAEGVGFVAAFCDALHAAHEAGIVHRDIKPDNLYLHEGPEGLECKVVDFGLAKVDVPDHTQIETAAGTVLGTPYYLAPERALGKPLTRSADLYSMGVVLYELATGVLPFDAKTFMAVLEGHVRRVPLDPRQAAPQRPIPAAMSELIMALLSKDPSQRPRTAAVVASTLRQQLRTEAEGLAACPTGPRATSSPDADTMSMLALASGHTAAPGVSATADAATVPPVASGAPKPSVVAAAAPPRRRGVLVAVAAGLGAIGLGAVVVGGSRDRGTTPASVPPVAEPAPDPVAANPPGPAPEPIPAEPQIESVVAVPKPLPARDPQARPRPSAKRAAGGTNASAKKRRPSASAEPDAEPPNAEAPKPKPKASKDTSLPAFKDEVYGD